MAHRRITAGQQKCGSIASTFKHVRLATHDSCLVLTSCSIRRCDRCILYYSAHPCSLECQDTFVHKSCSLWTHEPRLGVRLIAAVGAIYANSVIQSNNLFSNPSSISRDHNRRPLLCLLHCRDMGKVRAFPLFQTLSHDELFANSRCSTELLLGIIAANLALSRSIYKYFTQRARRTLTSNASGSRTTHLRNSFAMPTRMGYVKSTEPTSAIETAGSPCSQASGIPLRPYKNGAMSIQTNNVEKGVRY